MDGLNNRINDFGFLLNSSKLIEKKNNNFKDIKDIKNISTLFLKTTKDKQLFDKILQKEM